MLKPWVTNRHELMIIIYSFHVELTKLCKHSIPCIVYDCVVTYQASAQQAVIPFHRTHSLRCICTFLCDPQSLLQCSVQQRLVSPSESLLDHGHHMYATTCRWYWVHWYWPRTWKSQYPLTLFADPGGAPQSLEIHLWRYTVWRGRWMLSFSRN